MMHWWPRPRHAQLARHWRAVAAEGRSYCAATAAASAADGVANDNDHGDDREHIELKVSLYNISDLSSPC